MEAIVSQSPIVVAAQRGDADAREAWARDCVAIVGTRFMTSMLMAGAAELLAYGTAVVLEDEVDDS